MSSLSSPSSSRGIPNGNGAAAGRPPKPDSLSMRDVSECSIASLKDSIWKRREVLTRPEQKFLHELLMNGNEIEIQLAQENLESDLFDMDDSERSSSGWPSDGFRMGKERSEFSIRSVSENGDKVVEVTNLPSLLDHSSRTLSSGVHTNGTPLGSERRQMLLEERRNALVPMWKAHESGIPCSTKQSINRRTAWQQRSSRLSGSNRSGCGSSNGNVFRVMVDSKSDNSHIRYVQQKQQRNNNGLRPSLRRMQSEGSSRRRSVSFSNTDHVVHHDEGIKSDHVVHHDDEEAKIPPAMPPPERAERSASMSSIPSIHHAHPIQSQSSYPRKSSMDLSISSINNYQRRSSMESISSIQNNNFNYQRRSSMESIPSIHHAHHIHSPANQGRRSSISSIPSIHQAHPIRSNSMLMSSEYVDVYDEDEKKIPDQVPDKVVIPANESLLQDATKLLHENDPDAPIQPAAAAASTHRPVLIRGSSKQNEGMEVADMRCSSFTLETVNSGSDSLVTFGPGESILSRSNSFDETMSFRRALASNVFRRVLRSNSFSGEDSGVFLGETRVYLRETSSLKDQHDDDSSWRLTEEEDESDFYDAWKVVEDEYVNGYGGGGTLPFQILGTSASDVDAHPHVLSPPLMESLQAFLPTSKSGDNFWMKYSLVRDGASMHTFLSYARGSRYSILAVETLDGEVFGAFTAEPWRKNWNYFGNGEAFLWKMRKSRRHRCHSILDQAQMESEIDVFPYTGANHCIQLCTHDKIAVGGGSPSKGKEDQERDHEFKDHEWGFGITIEGDFLHGTTSPCLTFGSPSLSRTSPNGTLFEIMNLELWTFTPCKRLEDAEKLELGKLFLEKHHPKE